jgi:hypothetical protein
MFPCRAIVVVSQYTQSGATPERQIGKHVVGMGEGVRVIAYEIAGIDYDIGGERSDSLKGMNQI